MALPEHIDTLIFDLGGVLINLDQDRTLGALKRMMGTGFKELEAKAHAENIFEHFETGLLSAEQFRDFFRNHSADDISNERFDFIWNAMLLDIPKARIQLLERLSSRYRLFLLSNTNSIHIAHIHTDLQREHNSTNFEKWFEKVYYSFEIGMRKPSEDIYQHVIKENSLTPKNCVFIDDNRANLQGAEKCGLSTLLIAENQSVESFNFF